MRSHILHYDWSLTKIKKVEIKIHKLLTMHRTHHPKPDINRSHFSHKEGGRELVQLELSLKTSIIGIDAYNADPKCRVCDKHTKTID